MAVLPPLLLLSNNLFVSLFIYLFLFTLCFNILLNKLPFSKLKLPPSPPKLPIIGNLHQLGTLPHRSLRSFSQKYGPHLMLLHLGYTPTLVVSSAEMAREITKNHDIVFSDRPKTIAADIFFYKCLDVGFSPYNEYWRQARKVCVLELLTMKRVLSFEFTRNEETEELVCKIRKASVREEVVDLSEVLIATLNNIASRCILGRKFHEDDNRSKFGEIAKRVTIQFNTFTFGDFFPYLKWMDVIMGSIASFNSTFRELDILLDQIIEEHKKSISSEDEQKNKEDFLDILLQLQKDGMLEMKLTNVNLKAILFDMFVAGSDTTSSTVEWAMAELVRDASKMKKAQEEVRRVIRKKSRMDMNDINKMDYLKCVVKETLRLHPPVVLIYRKTSASVTLGGYHIPKKATVYINAWAIQRDPKLWDRPEEFVPERFENNPVDFRGQDFEFIPFGLGRRGCPGLTFGVFSVEYVLANLLHWFDWKLPSEELDMDEISGLTVHKKNPLVLLPVPYSP